jgi:hypothetical protein
VCRSLARHRDVASLFLSHPKYIVSRYNLSRQRNYIGIIYTQTKKGRRTLGRSRES